MNITEETIAILNQNFWCEFVKGALVAEPKQADKIFFYYERENGKNTKMIWKLFSFPKHKEVTINYVYDKINKELIFREFCSRFADKLSKDKFNCCYASSGLIIFSGYDRKKFESQKEKVDKLLTSLGIAFTFKHTLDESWVTYTYSKSNANNEIMARFISD